MRDTTGVTTPVQGTSTSEYFADLRVKLWKLRSWRIRIGMAESGRYIPCPQLSAGHRAGMAQLSKKSTCNAGWSTQIRNSSCSVGQNGDLDYTAGQRNPKNSELKSCLNPAFMIQAKNNDTRPRYYRCILSESPFCNQTMKSFRVETGRIRRFLGRDAEAAGQFHWENLEPAEWVAPTELLINAGLSFSNRWTLLRSLRNAAGCSGALQVYSCLLL